MLFKPFNRFQAKYVPNKRTAKMLPKIWLGSGTGSGANDWLDGGAELDGGTLFAADGAG